MDDNHAAVYAFGQAQPEPGPEGVGQDHQPDGPGSSRAAVDYGSVAAGQAPIFGVQSATAQFRPFTAAIAQPVPALDFNGFVLHAAPRPVPEELQRESSGASVAEPDAVMDEENGRTYHNYHEGRYYLPNDAVSPSETLRNPATLRLVRAPEA